MLILLPPSETKQLGGDLDAGAPYPFPELDIARSLVAASLGELCADSALAKKVLKFNNAEQLELNLKISQLARMPAAIRYTGVLYAALDAASLETQAFEQLGAQVYIQSSLFGLISALTPIPWYRLSAATSLPGLSLKKTWSQAHEQLWANLSQPIIDMRSRAYQELAPIPESIVSYQVDVLDESGRALNHFNKKAKGAFVRALLGYELTSVAQAEAAAIRAGLAFAIESNRLKLLVPAGF